MITLTPEIRLEQNRCYDCGTFWAVEQCKATVAQCPVCAGKRIQAAISSEMKAIRSARSLKALVNRN